ncbi:hypothetical protein BH11PSE3_BH11PSE3_48980 [soil metagenome]
MAGSNRSSKTLSSESVHDRICRISAALFASRGYQAVGGAGYATVHAVARCWRDARLSNIVEGTSEIQQRIISDHLLGKPHERGGAA